MATRTAPIAALVGTLSNDAETDCSVQFWHQKLGDVGATLYERLLDADGRPTCDPALATSAVDEFGVHPIAHGDKIEMQVSIVATIIR